MDFPITGQELKQVRRICGYSARELGEFMAELRIRPTSARRVYDIELMMEVPVRCASALEKLVGKDVFAKALEHVRKKEEERRQWYEQARQQRAERAAMEMRLKEQERERRRTENMQKLNQLNARGEANTTEH